MPLKLVKRHGQPSWYIRGSLQGRRYDESTGTGIKEQAEELLAIRQAEIVRGRVHGDRAVRTFADAALSFMEGGGEGRHLTPLIKRFGERPLGSLGQADINEACRVLKKGAAPATLNRQIIAPFSAVMHHAAKNKWCDKPVIARRKEPKGRVRWITHEEAERLILAAAPHLKPLVIFLLSTGSRLSEALYIDWRQINLLRRQATFLDTKNGTDRSVPLHPRAVAALEALPHRQGKVFRQHFGGPRWDGKVRPVGDPYADRGGAGGGQVKTAWKKMLERAKIDDFTPHDCRHTWATWHYQANKDLLQLMQLGGWKSLAMVERYAHVNVDNFAGSIAGVWGTAGGPAVSATPETLAG